MHRPYHWPRQDKDQEIGDPVHGAKKVIRYGVVRARTWGLRCPELLNWMTPGELHDEIRHEVSTCKEYDCPGRVTEYPVHAEEPKVEEENGEFVPEEAEHVQG